MDILITTGIFPPDVGGPATYVPAVAARLTRRGHRVRVVTLSEGGGGPAGDYPFCVVCLPRRGNKLLRTLRTVATIARLSRAADVVFVNGLALEAALAGLFCRRPLVQRVPGDIAWERARNRGWVSETIDEFQRTRHGWRIGLLKFLRDFTVRRADVVIAPSFTFMKIVQGWGVPTSRIEVVPNGIEDVLPDRREHQKPAPGVVAVGRLINIKNLSGLMEAVAGLPGVALTVVGSGPCEPDLKSQAARLGITDRAIFTGDVSQEEVKMHIRQASLLALNSVHENFPHVVLEAMQLGTPVVATAVGGNRELIRHGETGLLVAPGSVAELRAAVGRLLEDEALRERLARRAREEVARFSWERLIPEVERVLAEARGRGAHS